MTTTFAQEVKRKLDELGATFPASGPESDPPAPEVQEAQSIAPEPAREPEPDLRLVLRIPATARYSVEDLQILLDVLVQDVRLSVSDLVLLAQARQLMSTRPDGRIPFVMRKGVVAVHGRYCGKVVG